MSTIARMKLTKLAKLPPRSLAATVVALAALLCTAGCATTTRDFVDEAVGRAVLRGAVLELQSVSASTKKHYADGVSLEVTADGGRVTMRFGEQTRTIDLVRGAIVVLGEEVDAVILPQDAAPREPSGWPAR